MRRASCWLLLASLPLTSLATEPPARESTARYTLRGALTPSEATLAASRYTLDAGLAAAPQRDAPRRHGRAVRASLHASGAGQCLFPSLVFGDGFEAAP